MNLLKITKRDFINTAKNPTLLLCNTAFALLLIGIFGFITKNSYGNTVTSYDYYGITMIVYFIFMIPLTTSNTFMEKKIKPGNVRLVYSPTHTSIIFFIKDTGVFHICNFVLHLFAIDGNLSFRHKRWRA
ncbi:hypothetical protein [Clostridium acetobutylicum]|uniref:hypothetical protein n=1 Tax=Clostridium acetobutylicum TaxID=1488 RepID=UPI001829F6E7|nr:hypothetical protein [Clostridium acetobutylicum]NYC92382.1 hypothetical protein [Clostridium acetobutylicum]